MRWRDCIERDMRKAELEDMNWRMLAQDRAQWRMVVHRAAETCSHPLVGFTPEIRETRKREISRTECTRNKIQTAYEFYLHSLSDAIHFFDEKVSLTFLLICLTSVTR